VALKDEEGNIIAILDVNDVWAFDKAKEAKEVFGGDPVSYLFILIPIFIRLVLCSYVYAIRMIGTSSNSIFK
jgi:hypothetical protein